MIADIGGILNSLEVDVLCIVPVYKYVHEMNNAIEDFGEMSMLLHF